MDYDIGKAFEEIEDELIASMIRNLKRHQVQEVAEGKQWTQWQAEQLAALGRYRRNNQTKFSDSFNHINQQIRTVIQDYYNDGSTKQERQILQAIKRGYEQTGTNAPNVSNNVSTTGEFFRTNERKMDALIQATTHDMEQAETAVLRMANDQYRKIIFNAQVYANSGAGTYAQAVDMATKDFLSTGINCIEYQNGRRVNIKSYAEMALRTANKRAYLQGEGERRKEWGISTVIVQPRGNPCPLCLPFVGKVLIDDVWSDGKPDGEHKLMSEAIAAGLYHPNCKDIHTTYFEDLDDDEAEDATEQDRDNAVEDYNNTQKRNYAENQAEKYDRLAKYSLDESNQQKYEQKATEWHEKAESLPRNETTQEEQNTTEISESQHKELMELKEKIIEEAKDIQSKSIRVNSTTEKFSEESKPKVEKADAVVDMNTINSSQFRRKIDQLGETTEISREIYQQSKNILQHRSGTEYEDLVFIDTIKNKSMARTDYNVKKQCIPSKNMIKMVTAAKPYTIVAIHNHPNSSVPSINDIVSAYKKKYKYGIIVCHNGNIYKYNITGDFDELKVNFALDRLNRAIYNYDNGNREVYITKAIEELKLNNIEMEVFL